jgi:hypothetical protein
LQDLRQEVAGLRDQIKPLEEGAARLEATMVEARGQLERAQEELKEKVGFGGRRWPIGRARFGFRAGSGGFDVDR